VSKLRRAAAASFGFDPAMCGTLLLADGSGDVLEDHGGGERAAPMRLCDYPAALPAAAGVMRVFVNPLRFRVRPPPRPPAPAPAPAAAAAVPAADTAAQKRVKRSGSW
jgi:hypothetical protein